MIRKLKLEFICLSMAALIIMLALVVSGMNIINYNNMARESDSILEYIYQNNGAFPFQSQTGVSSSFSPETPYDSRYFSVLIDSENKIIETDTRRIMSVTISEAAEYAKRALQEKRNVGFTGNFRFLKSNEKNFTRITFLHCEKRLSAFRSFLFTSIGASVFGLLVVFVGIVFISGKIIKPVAESYDKQKRFVTNAGHEIKTPLAIINANIDILEASPDDEECINDIRIQTGRLSSLTDELVYLSRMEESGKTLSKEKLSLSDVVSEVATAFQAPASQNGKTISCDIRPSVFINGNHKSLTRLVYLLMDNAIKYSPPNSTIKVTLKKGLSNSITIQNETITPIEKKDLDMVFERFYRTDSSRNSETGGYGIGLSVARAIVLSHGGKIFATSDGKNSFTVNVIL